MQRSLFLLSTGAAFAASTIPAFSADNDDFYVNFATGEFGADISGVDIQGVLPPLHPQALAGTSAASAAAPASSSAFILKNLPPVMNQGAIGSCEAVSTGYCAGSIAAGRMPNGTQRWSNAVAGNQVSGGWLYSWLHQSGHASKCPGPSGPQVYAQKLVLTGAPSNADVPYNPNHLGTTAALCGYINSLNPNDPGPNPKRLMIGSYKAYGNTRNNKALYLDQFRALLRSGYAIQFSGVVPKGYLAKKPVLTNGVFVVANGFLKGAHGQAIVGFDDSRGSNGAFLVQNSFGTGWNPGAADDAGSNGRIWYDYDSWFAGQGLAMILYPNLDAAPSGTPLTHTAGTAPKLFVREGKRFVQDGKAYLTLILHATNALTLSKVTLTSSTGSSVAQALNESLRFGYIYAPCKPDFGPGSYTVALNATSQAGSNVTYRGKIDIA